MVWYGMVWYGMVWYGMVWYGMVWYGMVWYGVVYYDVYRNVRRTLELIGLGGTEVPAALDGCVQYRGHLREG